MAQDQQQHVLIIGGGMAGMTAALAASSLGARVTLLEAGERLGGRVRPSSQFAGDSDSKVDLGAAWIHGGRHHPVLELAQRLGWATRPAVFAPELQFLTSGPLEASTRPMASAKPVTPTDLKHATALHTLVIQQMEQLEPPENKDPSVAEVLAMTYANLRHTRADLPLLTSLPRDPLNRHEPGPDAVGRLYNSIWAYEEAYHAANLGDMSFRYFKDDACVPGGDHDLAGGYATLLSHLEGLIRNSPGIHVQLNTRVLKVCHTPGTLVTVVAFTSAETSHIITADCCIVAVPLAVLRYSLQYPTASDYASNSMQFDPPLSTAKQAAIVKLGTGTLDKVAIEFAEAFWPKDMATLRCVGPTRFAGCPTIVPKFEFRSWVSGVQFGGVAVVGKRDVVGSNFWLHVPNQSKSRDAFVPPNGHVLVVYLHADSAIDMEQQPPKDTLAAILVVLRSIFGQEKVTPVITFTRTKWFLDPLFRGSYGHLPPGATGELFDTLAAPEAGSCLFFAGEHCNRPFNGMVNGAIWSGVAAAQAACTPRGQECKEQSICTVEDLVELLATGSYHPKVDSHADIDPKTYRLDGPLPTADYHAWKARGDYGNHTARKAAGGRAPGTCRRPF